MKNLSKISKTENLKKFLVIFSFSILIFTACGSSDEENENPETEDQNTEENTTEENNTEENSEDSEEENTANNDFSQAEIVNATFEDPAGRYSFEGLENLELIYANEATQSFSNGSQSDEYFSVDIHVEANEENLGAEEFLQGEKSSDYEEFEEVQVITDTSSVSSSDGTEGKYYISQFIDFGFPSYGGSAVFIKNDNIYSIRVLADASAWEVNPDRFLEIVQSFEIQ